MYCRFGVLGGAFVDTEVLYCSTRNRGGSFGAPRYDVDSSVTRRHRFVTQ